MRNSGRCVFIEKGMEKRKHVMLGGPFQKRKHREIAVGIGSHIHVEMVTKKIAFPERVPSPVAVRLGIMARTVKRGTAFLLTITDLLFALLGSSRIGVPSPVGEMIGSD